MRLSAAIDAVARAVPHGEPLRDERAAYRPEGAVRIVEETGEPIAAVARDLVVGTWGNWVKLTRESRDGSSAWGWNYTIRVMHGVARRA